MALLRLCVQPGCDDVAVAGGNRCAAHAIAAEARAKARRAAAKSSAGARAGSALYADRKWRKAARAHLDAHPLCVSCASVGVLTEAREVDHVTPHRGDRVLFWDRSNWQSLCRPCHSRKTAREVLPGRRPDPPAP